MIHWGASLDKQMADPQACAVAKRIRDALAFNNGPLWERELKKRAGVDSIGVHFAYLHHVFGICRIDDYMHRPDDDDKLYFLASQVELGPRSRLNTEIRLPS